MPIHIDRQAFNLDHLFPCFDLRPPSKDRLHPQNQFPRTKGFGNIVVRSQLKTHDAIDLFGLRGEHDDRNVPSHRIRFKGSTDISAIHPGKHQVEDDERRPEPSGLLQPGRAALRLDYLETRLPQMVFHQIGNVFFIFDDQDGLRQVTLPWPRISE